MDRVIVNLSHPLIPEIIVVVRGIEGAYKLGLDQIYVPEIPSIGNMGQTLCMT